MEKIWALCDEVEGIGFRSESEFDGAFTHSPTVAAGRVHCAALWGDVTVWW